MIAIICFLFMWGITTFGMESEARGSDEKDNKNDESDEEKDKVQDVRLDFYSAKFDPWLALNSKELQPPLKDATVFDSLAMFDLYIKRQNKDVKERDRSEPKPGSSTVIVQEQQGRFEPRAHRITIEVASEARASTSNPAKKDESNEGKDKRLDFYSDKFDPLFALKSKELQPPVKDARVFDNLAMFDSHFKRPKGDSSTNIDVKVRGRPKPGSLKPQDQQVLFQRRFEPHQMPIKSEKKLRKQLHTVLTRMSSHADNEGVFGVMEKARTQGLQIKVTIRHGFGIRGVCIAHLTTFDKYWNMTLKNVEEYWIRRRKPRIPAIGTPTKQNFSRYFPKMTTLNIDKLSIGNDAACDEMRNLAKMLQSNECGMNNKNSELCHRHVNELLVRGEQVVFIAIAQGRQS